MGDRARTLLGSALVGGLCVAAAGSHILIAQPAAITRTMLQQKDLEASPGREVVMYRAEIAPGGAVGKHFHPGPEFIYILEGALVFEHDGQAPVTLKAGESTYLPAKHIHNATNASSTQQAKAVVFLVGEKGQPIATPVK